MKRASLWLFLGGLLTGILATVVLYQRMPGARARADALPARSSMVAAPPPHSHLPPGEIVIDSAMLQNLGVRTAAVQARSLARTIRTTGYIDYDQRRLRQVNARVDGWVQQLYVAYVGQQVRQGQALMSIYSPELMLTQADYLRSRQLATGKDTGSEARADAGDLMSAAESRLRLFNVAPSEVSKLERSGAVSTAVPMSAPAGGVVTDIRVTEGSYVKLGASCYTIADLSTVWVYADIYERELPMARIGQHATVTSDALPGQSFDGRVAFIYPTVNEQTRTVRLRLELANPRSQLRPGMFVAVTLRAPATRAVLAVPSEAVLNSGLRRVVMLALGNGHFAPREITTGPEAEGYTPVLAGLYRGERVVTSGQFLLDSESSLNEALNAMAPEQADSSTSVRPSPAPR